MTTAISMPATGRAKGSFPVCAVGPDRRSCSPDRIIHTVRPAWQYAAGAGPGLPATRAIVRAHGGEFALESRRGGGATARFTLHDRFRLAESS